jgi:hypothetical protein
MTDPHSTEVDFRGEKRTVEFEHEGDGVILWWFETETILFGIGTTQAEQDDIYAVLWAYLEDYHAPRPEDDQ